MYQKQNSATEYITLRNIGATSLTLQVRRFVLPYRLANILVGAIVQRVVGEKFPLPFIYQCFFLKKKPSLF